MEPISDERVPKAWCHICHYPIYTGEPVMMGIGEWAGRVAHYFRSTCEYELARAKSFDSEFCFSVGIDLSK